MRIKFKMYTESNWADKFFLFGLNAYVYSYEGFHIDLTLNFAFWSFNVMMTFGGNED